MKKLLFAIAVTLGLSPLAHAVCDSRTTTCLTAVETSGDATIDGNASVGGTLSVTGRTSFTSPFVPYSRTKAQLNALAASSVGQFVFCSDCARSAMCVSTGTATGAWSITVSTDTSPAYTSIHCQ